MSGRVLLCTRKFIAPEILQFYLRFILPFTVVNMLLLLNKDNVNLSLILV